MFSDGGTITISAISRRRGESRLLISIITLSAYACHAMGEKGGVLNVSIANVEIDGPSGEHNPDLKSGSYIELIVSDTGHGMEPDIVKRIFEPYYTTKEIGEGTGLGLSVIHGIVQSHNGTINVDSEPGKGTEESSHPGTAPASRRRVRLWRIDAEIGEIDHLWMETS